MRKIYTAIALLSTLIPGSCKKYFPGDPSEINKIKHVVVIYLENHSST